ncbi:MAG TPA: hypothetical protein PKV72_05920 [Candidatus Peribacteria bacterium]|nr:hypothetical protein [Candidatus Peribacteria bacterium]
MRTARLVAAFLLLAGLPAADKAYAHLTGQSFEVPAGEGRLIDAGCDQPVIAPGQETFCTFALIEQPQTFKWRLAPYDSIEVRVERTGGGEEPFTQTVKASHDTMSYVSFALKRAGPHDLRLRFLSGSTLAAEQTFALAVTPEPQIFTSRRITMTVAALFFGLIGWTHIWIPHRRKKI